MSPSACEICGKEFFWSAHSPYCSPAHLEESLLIPKLRLQLETDYEVLDGRIASPGQFEGAEIFAAYFSLQAARGRGFQIDDLVYIEINRVEQRVFPELQGAAGIVVETGAQETSRLSYFLLQTREEFDEAVLLEMTGLLQQKRSRKAACTAALPPQRVM